MAEVQTVNVELDNKLDRFEKLVTMFGSDAIDKNCATPLGGSVEGPSKWTSPIVRGKEKSLAFDDGIINIDLDASDGDDGTTDKLSQSQNLPKEGSSFGTPQPTIPCNKTSPSINHTQPILNPRFGKKVRQSVASTPVLFLFVPSFFYL